MKAGKYLKIYSIFVALVVIILIFTTSTVVSPESESVSTWSLPSDLGRMLGFYEDVELPDEVNVLVIGVDSRKGSHTVHCDAIHMVQINLVDETMVFVNVPRGTFSYIPGYPQSEQYISNVCEYLSVDEFVSRVGAMTGYKADYRMLVGFSQAQGLLRAMSFDPTTTLQFLRHRQSYAIGDPQRSYNQSVFLSDLVSTRLDDIQALPLAARFAIFQMIDTDMPHSYADALFSWLANSKIPKDETRITHVTKPDWAPIANKMHFDEDDADEQLKKLYDVLRYHIPDFTVSNVQPVLKDFLDNSVGKSYIYLNNGNIQEARSELDIIIDQQLWNQIENADDRKNAMVAVAILDSTIEWYRTHDQDSSLKLATSLIGLLELEDNSDASSMRIREHLIALLKNRI